VNNTFELKPTTTKKKRADLERVIELVYRTAGFLPKGCGSMYRFGRKRDRSQAVTPHDCLAIATVSREYEGVLECPMCARLINQEQAAKLVRR
jgi:hypothetical protein